MDDPTDNYVYACLKYDFQVHEALASTKPPFDNYFNISRAIYPSEDVPSKLVNIWVHFTNSSVNLTEVNQLKFIWSRSCLYVSDRYLSLRAMGLYSLFTIWPDRGQEDLHITLYQFCDPRQTKRKLINFLSTVRPELVFFDFSQQCFLCLHVLNFAFFGYTITLQHKRFTDLFAQRSRIALLSNIC